MPRRAMPRVGGSVRVEFLGGSVRGTVGAVAADGRALEVTTEEGERLSFVLNRATATFTTDGQLTGARLSFDAGDQETGRR